MKFEVGDQFKHGGVEYRVIEGRNAIGDMIMEFRLPGSDWHRPKIVHSLILTDFKYQVEDNNYPPPALG